MTLDASPDIRRHSTPALSRNQAVAWLDRWDDQQSVFFVDREERFAVIGDVVEHLVERPDPQIVDLGCGPGSLSARLLARLPGARVVGVDMDPLLLGLADAACGGERFRTVRADMRRPGWWDELGLDRAPEAIVSTTALHYLEREPLMAVLRTAAGGLAPGGVLVNADHLFDSREPDRPEPLDALARCVAQGACDRRRPPTTRESRMAEWLGWWESATQAPELADLVSERDQTDVSHAVQEQANVTDYLDALRSAGCRHAGVVWQYGDDRVLVGVR